MPRDKGNFNNIVGMGGLKHQRMRKGFNRRLAWPTKYFQKDSPLVNTP